MHMPIRAQIPTNPLAGPGYASMRSDYGASMMKRDKPYWFPSSKVVKKSRTAERNWGVQETEESCNTHILHGNCDEFFIDYVLSRCLRRLRVSFIKEWFSKEKFRCR